MHLYRRDQRVEVQDEGASGYTTMQPYSCKQAAVSMWTAQEQSEHCSYQVGELTWTTLHLVPCNDVVQRITCIDANVLEKKQTYTALAADNVHTEHYAMKTVSLRTVSRARCGGEGGGEEGAGRPQET